MKNSFQFLSILMISLSLMLSCNKKQESENLIENQVQPNLKESAVTPPAINITCTGECPDGDQCYFTIVGSNGFGQCDCEGCTLVIDFPDGGNDNSMSEQELLGELATKDLFINDLENFVFRKFGTDQYGIKRFDYTPSDNNNYYIQY
jgi:hypothetical protein